MHSLSILLVIDDGIHFKIQVKTSYIHIRRTDHDNLPVDNHGFGMYKAFGVPVDMHSCLQQLKIILLGCRIDQHRITYCRNQNVHIYSTFS